MTDSPNCNLFTKSIYQKLTGNANSTIACCQSQIKCNAQNEIISINLPNRGLKGQISSDFAQLTSLTEINFTNNSLTGTIPDLSACNQLKSLLLNINKLTGSLPASIGKITTLENLIIHDNELSGPIPSSIGNLVNLINFNLGYNKLTTIPPELGNLRKVQLFVIMNNAVTGKIPETLGQLALCERLFLNNNQLTGTIPPELGNLAYLTNLDLSFNKLSGSIPTSLGNLVNMDLIDMSTNTLTGPIPSELGKMLKVQEMNFGGNQLSLPIPDSIKSIPKYSPEKFQFGTTVNRPVTSASPTPSTSTSPVPTTESFLLAGSFGSWLLIGVGATICVAFCVAAVFRVWQFIGFGFKKQNNDVGHQVETGQSNSFPIKPKASVSEMTSPSRQSDTLVEAPTNMAHAIGDYSDANNEFQQKPRSQLSSGTKQASSRVMDAISGISNKSGTSGNLFFFSDLPMNQEFVNAAISLFLPINVDIMAAENYIPINTTEITVTKGDVLQVQVHRMDGWCLGRNVTQDCNGVFPIYCVAPFHQVRLSFIHCSQSPNPSPVSEEVQYIQSAFTDYIKIHHVDKFMLQESSLYPVFNTLIGDERCFVHGSDEFTQTITELLVSFGESFWKPLDITKIE